MDDIKFDAILYIAAKRAGQPELDLYNSAGDGHLPSKRFMRRMRRFINRAIRQEIWEEWKPFTTTLKRIAIAAMLVCTVSLGGVLSIKAAREAIWSTIVEWYEEYIEIDFVTQDEVDIPSEILEFREPTAGLEGYERYEVGRTGVFFIVEYENETSLIVYKQSIAGDSSFAITNENSTQHRAVLNDRSANYFECEINGMKLVTLVWSDGIYQYSLQGNVSIDKLLSIAESVK